MACHKKAWMPYFLAAAAILLLTLASLGAALWPRPVEAEGAPGRFSDLAELQDFIDSQTKIASLLGQTGIFYSSPVLSPITRQGAAVTDMALGSNEAAATSKQAAAPGAAGAGAASDFSTTNNQVAGVDEADIVKSDGSYLYVRSGQKIVILAAYPADGARVVSSLTFDSPPVGLFVHGSRMLAVTQQEPVFWPMLETSSGSGLTTRIYPPSPGYNQPRGLKVFIYDTSDKANPKLQDSFTLSGASYVASRMIGGYVYLIANTPLNLDKTQESGQSGVRLPEIIEGNGSVTTFPATAIQYFKTPYPSYRYTMVQAYNLEASTRKTSVFLTGATQDVFASTENIYLASPAPVDPITIYQKYQDRLVPLLPASLTDKLQDPNAGTEQKLQQLAQVLTTGNSTGPGNQAEIGQLVTSMQQDLLRAQDQTLVQKFRISGYDAAFQAEARVPGQVLNQYSMDEEDGYFRIATTTREQLQQDSSENNIFVYGPGLQQVGQLTGLAPGERIYSARFLGKRAYLVTFKQIDPFFVVDLADPAAPKVLGYLKIPGFSNYLHPYDDNHVIGIGKDTTDNPQEGGRPRPTGLKIALFDATNPEQPTELSRYVFPEGTDSSALYDPKAFLFSRSKNLLALPVSSPHYSGPYYSYWQGADIFSISLDKGIVLRGGIDHATPAPQAASGDKNLYVAPYRQFGNVQRILYIEDVLYTVSDSLVKLNDFDSLTELKSLGL
jgi:inhibitor of cysteine peptidase